MKLEVRRGDIWKANMGESVGSEQGGLRPVIVVQNNVGNKFSPTYITIPLTSKAKPKLPTHGALNAPENGLDVASTFMAEQIHTLDRSKMLYKMGRLTSNQMAQVDVALRISIDLIVMQNGYKPIY